MDIRDFFKGARRKGPRPADQSAAPSAEPGAVAEIDESEKNLVHASMGFRFKCGVCRKVHKSSILEKVKSLKGCIGAVVKVFGSSYNSYSGKRSVKKYGNREVSDGAGVRFLPDPVSADSIAFTFRAPNAFRPIMPTSSFFKSLYPKTAKRFDDFCERLDQVMNRELVEELSMKEALGAPETMAYVKARYEGFEKRASAEIEKLQKEQEASDPETFRLAREWKKMKPERFKVGVRETGNRELTQWFQKKEPTDSKPIRRIKINGYDWDAETILGSFRTVSGAAVWNTNYAHDTIKVLFDVGLVSGYPAISWGLVAVRDMGRSRRMHRHQYKGSSVMSFVSLWDGTIMLNMGGADGDYNLRSLIDSKCLLTLNVPSDSLVAEEAATD